MLASISIDQSSNQLFLNAESPQTLSTKILGMTVEINITGSQQSILIAEVVLGALEAFFATAIEIHVMPHTEKLSINLIEDSEILSPSFEINEMDMTGIIIWPTRMPIENLEHQRGVLTFLQECSGKILAFTCMTKDIETLLEKLFVDEAVQGRMTMIEVSLSSYHRVTSEYLLQMSEWQDKVKRTYEPQDIRPTVSKVDLKKGKIVESKEETTDKALPKPTDHRTLDVRSVIDIHAWNKARWRGATYLQFDPSKPPCIIFLFENEEGARNIFQRWRERFSHFDENDEIYLAIVRELPQQSKYHYTIMVTSKQPDADDAKQGKIFSIASRCLTVTPSTGENLENFLEIHSRFRAFYLLPAFLKKDGEPEIINGLMILKKNLVVKLAKDVGNNDIEIMALGPRENDKE